MKINNDRCFKCGSPFGLPIENLPCVFRGKYYCGRCCIVEFEMGWERLFNETTQPYAEAIELLEKQIFSLKTQHKFDMGTLDLCRTSIEFLEKENAVKEETIKKLKRQLKEMKGKE